MNQTLRKLLEEISDEYILKKLINMFTNQLRKEFHQ